MTLEIQTSGESPLPKDPRQLVREIALPTVIALAARYGPASGGGACDAQRGMN
jgi:hypothetical protein